MIEPITLNRNSLKWQYSYGGRWNGEYKSKRVAAVAYVKNLIEREPKYKPLFTGKSWAQIFKMVGVNL